MANDGPLSADELDRLRALPSPTVANAIETFNVRQRSEGFMGPEIKCIFPQFPPMVAYAATAVISARLPASDKPRIAARELWDHILSIPQPRVLVVQDIDYPHPIGSYWGEVNGNIYKALGCVGTVTNGGVRDLDEVEEMGFYYFASTLLVSHAYIHLWDAGIPVEVGGLVVRPGDLLHGDKHGVTNIPIEIAKQVPQAAKQVEERERRIIDLCRSPGMTPEKFPDAMSQGR